jgi:hypothetical protein
VGYDPELGRFITSYQYSLNNPVNYSDPTGEIVETAWDVVSLGIGVLSLAHNLEEGNYGAAVLDVLGIAVDAVAVAVPLVPGGAGAALKVSQAAGLLANWSTSTEGSTPPRSLPKSGDKPGARFPKHTFRISRPARPAACALEPAELARCPLSAPWPAALVPETKERRLRAAGRPAVSR